MKIIGMVPVFNEEDIIQEVLENLISQGLELVILDNNSTDNSFKICESFLDKGVVNLEKIDTGGYRWDLILRMLYDMALTETPDWVIRCDADEILESGTTEKTIVDVVKDADEEGSNIIQFDRFDFLMTDDDQPKEKLIQKRMPYYSYHGDWAYRAWKYFPGIRIGDGEGHYPIFPVGLKYKFYSKKMVLRHYTFRSEKQAQKKMEFRMRNKGMEENEIPFDQHEKKILRQDYSERFDHKKLIKYNEDGNWDFKIRFTPFGTKNPPKRDDVFNKDGILIKPQRTVWEYKLLLSEKEAQLKELKNKTEKKYLSRSRVSGKLKRFVNKQ